MRMSGYALVGRGALHAREFPTQAFVRLGTYGWGGRVEWFADGFTLDRLQRFPLGYF